MITFRDALKEIVVNLLKNEQSIEIFKSELRKEIIKNSGEYDTRESVQGQIDKSYQLIDEFVKELEQEETDTDETII